MGLIRAMHAFSALGHLLPSSTEARRRPSRRKKASIFRLLEVCAAAVHGTRASKGEIQLDLSNY